MDCCADMAVARARRLRQAGDAGGNLGVAVANGDVRVRADDRANYDSAIHAAA